MLFSMTYQDIPTTYAPRSTPLAHQYEALSYGWRRDFFAYFLEMGLGKTRIALDDFLLNYEDDRVDGLLVVAPKGVYGNWAREDDGNPGELQRWMWAKYQDTARVYMYRAGRKTPDAAARRWLLDNQQPSPRILLVNVEALATTVDAAELVMEFCKVYRTMIVVDESTIMKNPKAQRTKLLHKLSLRAAMRRIMTGSPSTGSQSDLWGQFEFLRPNNNPLGFRKFILFQAHFNKMIQIQAGGHTVRKEAGPANTEELQRLVAMYSFRRRKVDCLDLPPKQYQYWEVELTAEQKTVYRELREFALAKVSIKHLTTYAEVSTELVVTQLMRMHCVICGHVKTDDGVLRRLDSNRMAAVADIVGATEEQVVIWCHWRPDALLVAGELRKLYGDDSVAEWHGEIGMAQREAGEADFQAGRRRFMVATDQAGARGRTWTAATLVIYYSNGYDWEIREQSEDRTHRIGTKGTVTYVDLVTPDSVDEKIIRALRAKRSVARAVVQDGLEAWI
jgi:SNF2 family DNA or RNA helicase